MPTAPLGRSLMAAAVLAGGLTAQAVVDLREIPTGRGSVLLGEPAVTGTPRSTVAGELGASCTFVDLNGDGFDEYVVGAPTLSGVPVGGVANNTGHVYIRFGDAEAGAPGSEPDEDLAALTPGQGLNIRGRVGDLAGSSLAAAGDVDGDGFQDLIIGAPGHNAPGRTDSGAFYILFGAADLGTLGPLLSLVDLGAAGRTRLFFGPRAFGEVGTSVAGDVDVDNDGFDDLVAGAPLDSTGGLSQNGAAYVVYGDATLKAVGDVDMATLGAGSLTEVRGTEDFQLLGSSVAGLGNYDPVLPGLGGLEDLEAGDDVALGAPGTLENGNLFTGAVFVLRGQTSGPLPVLLDVDAFVGGDSPGLEIVGDQPGDQAGSFVANGGDLFGNDGFNELVIGAPLNDGPGRLDCGAFYLVPGRFGGVNPEPFDLSDIGPFDPRPAIQIWGAVTLDGRDGLSASQVGDFDTDGFLDLAVAFPGANVPDGVNFMPEAGIVIVIGSLVLDPTQVHTIDLGTQLPFAQIFRLEGDATNARGGTSLAVGDLNGDGKPDFGIGAPGAPSEPSVLDPTGQAHFFTGRGQVIYGSMARVASIDPVISHFDGPAVRIRIYQLFQGGVNVTFDGVPAGASGGGGGSPGFLDILAPPPLNPGAGDTVDVVVNTPKGSQTLPDAFTYLPLSIATGPVPTQLVPGVEMQFTGEAISSDTDMMVTVNGALAPIVASDPLAGTFSASAPAGQPGGVPLDVAISSSNGSVLLPGAVMYSDSDFIVTDITPTSGPQTSGIEALDLGLVFEGQPVVPVSMRIVTPSVTIPPETTVEFGTDALGYQEAVIQSIAGDILTCELPYNLLGPMDVPVNIRVTNGKGEVIVENGFTYEASSFTLRPETENPGFGDPPRTLGAGEFEPNGRILVVFEGHDPAVTDLGWAFAGLSAFDPPVPFFGGLLMPLPDVVRVLPQLSMQDQFAFDLPLGPNPGMPGSKIFVQLVVQETDMSSFTLWSHSATLEITVGP